MTRDFSFHALCIFFNQITSSSVQDACTHRAHITYFPRLAPSPCPSFLQCLYIGSVCQKFEIFSSIASLTWGMRTAHGKAVFSSRPPMILSDPFSCASPSPELQCRCLVRGIKVCCTIASSLSVPLMAIWIQNAAKHRDVRLVEHFIPSMLVPRPFFPLETISPTCKFLFDSVKKLGTNGIPCSIRLKSLGTRRRPQCCARTKRQSCDLQSIDSGRRSVTCCARHVFFSFLTKGLPSFGF
jgi:hypothetical protein